MNLFVNIYSSKQTSKPQEVPQKALHDRQNSPIPKFHPLSTLYSKTILVPETLFLQKPHIPETLLLQKQATYPIAS